MSQIEYDISGFECKKRTPRLCNLYSSYNPEFIAHINHLRIKLYQKFLRNLFRITPKRNSRVSGL